MENKFKKGDIKEMKTDKKPEVQAGSEGEVITPILEKSFTVSETVDIEKIRKEAEEAGAKKELERQKTIRELCVIPGTENLALQLINEGRSISDAKDLILKHLSTVKAPVSTSDFDINSGLSESEKFRSAAIDCLAMKRGKVNNPAPGAQSMLRLGFLRIAKLCLEQQGIKTFMMGNEEIVSLALGRRNFGSQFSSRAPSMATGDFSHILGNSANKILLMGFNNVRTTYQIWMKIGSLPDFKTYDRIRLSDAPGFDLIPEGGEVKYGKLTDMREQQKLYTYAKNMNFTREALINDDMGAFDVFEMYGASAARKIEAIAYSPLIDNPTMSDTGALFNTTAETSTGGHANMAASGSAPSNSTVSDGEISMAAHKCPNQTTEELGIIPKYIIYGMYHKGNVFILLNSAGMPVSQMSSAVANPMNDKNFNGGYVPVMSPAIKTNVKKWFLASEYTQEPTLEVVFLDGNSSPILTEMDQTPNALGKTYQGVLDVGIKALSHRGLYYNAGE